MRANACEAATENRMLSGGREAALALLLAAGFAPAGAATGAADACVSMRERPLQAIEAIRVEVHGFPAGLLPAVERAMAFWNHTNCNSDSDFPRFRFATDEPHRVLHVRWVKGPSPIVEGSCGAFSGNEIVLYSHARVTRGGAVRTCGNSARVAETLAHELGHALGLKDQYGAECSGFIMGQLTRTRSGSILERRVRAQECAAADGVFLTLAERTARTVEDLLAGRSDPAPAAALTSPAAVAGSRPPAARIALGIPATESDGFRP
jgi:hypothetical protein